MDNYEGLLNEIQALFEARAPTRNMVDYVSRRTGIPIKSQDLANLKRDRLGGGSAVQNLRQLLAQFASFEGSRSLILDDSDGQVCGIVFQSPAQRVLCEYWGDNLLLDWTHNTNNVGFYLGKF